MRCDRNPEGVGVLAGALSEALSEDLAELKTGCPRTLDRAPDIAPLSEVPPEIVGPLDEDPAEDYQGECKTDKGPGRASPRRKYHGVLMAALPCQTVLSIERLLGAGAAPARAADRGRKEEQLRGAQQVPLGLPLCVERAMERAGLLIFVGEARLKITPDPCLGSSKMHVDGN